MDKENLLEQIECLTNKLGQRDREILDLEQKLKAEENYSSDLWDALEKINIISNKAI